MKVRNLHVQKMIAFLRHLTPAFAMAFCILLSGCICYSKPARGSLLRTEKSNSEAKRSELTITAAEPDYDAQPQCLTVSVKGTEKLIWKERNIYAARLLKRTLVYGPVTFPLLCRKLGPYAFSKRYFSEHRAFSVTKATGYFPLLNMTDHPYAAILDIPIMVGTCTIDVGKTCGVVLLDTLGVTGGFTIDCAIALVDLSTSGRMNDTVVELGELPDDWRECSSEQPLNSLKGHYASAEHEGAESIAELNDRGSCCIPIDKFKFYCAKEPQIPLHISIHDVDEKAYANTIVNLESVKMK